MRSRATAMLTSRSTTIPLFPLSCGSPRRGWKGVGCTVVILILRRTTPSLRGELSRWMIEPQAGVFVGNISALVRQALESVLEQRRCQHDDVLRIAD